MTRNEQTQYQETMESMYANQDTSGLLCEAYSFFNDNAINSYLKIMIGSWRYAQ